MGLFGRRNENRAAEVYLLAAILGTTDCGS